MAIVKVDITDLKSNPQCVHGPTLKFSRLVNGEVINFYACSAYRDRKDCQFYLLEGEKFDATKKARWDLMKESLRSKHDPKKLHCDLRTVLSLPVSQRRFCTDCNILFSNINMKEHNNHEIFANPITDHLLKCPTKLLTPLQNDKKEAQYWFANETVFSIISFLKNLQVRKVVCIGTPRIHENCSSNGLTSLLMDIDPRYYSFYSPNEYLWFNMFNFHFMRNEDSESKVLEDFMKGGKTAVIIDPPFGARYEGLSYTLEKISAMHSNVNKGSNLLTFLLILPYFMEPRIAEMDSNLKKLDYSVEYVNHRFKKKKTPVRLFTNADQSLFPVNSRAKFCDKCNQVAQMNTHHCLKCSTCHDETFNRCGICLKCTKKSYFHCKNCNICVNSNHICSNERNNFIKNKRRKK